MEFVATNGFRFTQKKGCEFISYYNYNEGIATQLILDEYYVNFICDRYINTSTLPF